MTVKHYTEKFTIRASETDAHGTMSFPSLCNLLQEIAGNNALKLGFSIEQMMQQQVTWVITRLKVEMKRLPKWREEIYIETWPSEADRMLASRDFIIYDVQKKEIGRATSFWMLLNLKTRRPVGIRDYLGSTEPDSENRSLIIQREDRIPEISIGHKLTELVCDVRFADLDLNQHVNNVHYLSWAMEALPSEIHFSWHPIEVDIQFRAETHYGDKIVSKVSFEKEETMLSAIHYLERVNDGKEVARLKTKWIKNERVEYEM